MILPNTFGIILVGMMIAWVCALYAQHLRIRHPEKYRGIWVFWGEANRPAWRATLPFVGIFIGAILANGIHAFFSPNQAYLLIIFLMIVLGVAFYYVLQRK